MPEYVRERMELDDGDFLDVDWLQNHQKRCVIVSHGLEGNSQRPYVKGMAKIFFENDWDVAAWNYRSCSDEMNRLKRLYHHGVTDDLERIVKFVVSKGYSQIALVGVSMGGSTTLKYLGEQGPNAQKEIIGAAVFSVPCNLHDSGEQLKKRGNKIYRERFLKKLIDKVKRKAAQYPEMDIKGIDNIQTFDEFDERFTAPLHGFKNALDFYQSSTSDQYYPSIRKPVLIANALNDPMLGEKCYPYQLAEESEFILLETPKIGGHVGFTVSGDDQTWAERRALEYISQFVK